MYKQYTELLSNLGSLKSLQKLHEEKFSHRNLLDDCLDPKVNPRKAILLIRNSRYFKKDWKHPSTGETYLHLASKRGCSVAVIDELIKRGVNVKETDDEGNTANVAESRLMVLRRYADHDLEDPRLVSQKAFCRIALFRKKHFQCIDDSYERRFLTTIRPEIDDMTLFSKKLGTLDMWPCDWRKLGLEPKDIPISGKTHQLALSIIKGVTVKFSGVDYDFEIDCENHEDILKFLIIHGFQVRAFKKTSS